MFEQVLTKEVFPEIQLDEVIKENIEYTKREKIEDTVDTLIFDQEIYDDEIKMKEMIDTVKTFSEIIDENENTYYDTSDKQPFIKDMLYRSKFQLPPCLLPIVDNKKILYKTEEDDPTEYEGTINRDHGEYLDDYLSLFDETDATSQVTYSSVIQNIIKYKRSYINDNTNITYNGTYFRSCNPSSPCQGLNTTYLFDIQRTRSDLVLKTNDNTEKTFIPKEKLSLSGINMFPPRLWKHTLKSKLLNVKELYSSPFLFEDYKPFSKKMKDEDIIPHFSSKDTRNEYLQPNDSIHSYLFDNTLDYDELVETLQNNIPTMTQIIDTLPLQVTNNIMNYNDINKILAPYGFSYQSLDPENRKRMNSFIIENIETYTKQSKPNKYKSIQSPEIRLLSESEKIELCMSFIQKILSIPQKNHYMKKLIQEYSREARIDENNLFLYEKNSDKQLCCTHYLHHDIHESPDKFYSFISKYGEVPKEGAIYCRICGDYLCPEEFTSFQGHSSNSVTIDRAVEETSEKQEYTKTQLDHLKQIRVISSFLNTQLVERDEQTILQNYELLSGEEFVDTRYSSGTQFFKQHPNYLEIIEKYKVTEKPKTKAEKATAKKLKLQKTKELSVFKQYLVDCNRLLFFTISILFIIQTSIPAYPSVQPGFELWKQFTKNDTWPSVKTNINQYVSSKIIDNVIILLRKITQKRNDSFWKNASKFMKESSTYPGIKNIKEQLNRSINYFMKNDVFKQKLEVYFVYQQSSEQNTYYKESWSSFKPQKDNTTVESINKIVSDSYDKNIENIQQNILKTSSGISYQNISTILTLEKASKTPRYKVLKIPYSYIMKNESFKRLYNYSIQLEGDTLTNLEYLNVLLRDFLNTIDFSNEIENLLSPINWNKQTKETKKINYNDLKRLFVIDIPEFFSKKDPKIKNAMDLFNHSNTNNFDRQLLSAKSKRDYSYKQPIVFITGTVEENKKLIESLFEKYCRSSDGTVVETEVPDEFIKNIIHDPDMVDREIQCKSNIPINEETLQEILDFKKNKTSIPMRNIPQTNDKYESRLFDFITNSRLLEQDADENYRLLKAIMFLDKEYDNKEKQYSEWEKVFNGLLGINESYLEKIQEFYLDAEENKLITPTQIKRFQSLFGRSLKSLRIVLDKMLEKSSDIPNKMKSFFRILGRLVYVQDGTIGTILHDYIPKEWKLSETNVGYISEFIREKEFLLHNDMFKKSNDTGFHKYKTNPELSRYFQNLYDSIQNYKLDNINTLIGENNSPFTEEYSDMFLQFLFLSLISKTIDSIQSLRFESPSLQKSNILFNSLETQEINSIEEAIMITTQFSFDIILHYLEEYVDPNWIHQTQDSVSEKVSKQKEREKQSIIDDLESKPADSRLVTGFLQNFGIESFYADTEQRNLDHVYSQQYTEQVSIDQQNVMEELFSDFDERDVDLTTIEEGYDQSNNYDEDELEGMQDNDDNGDYREN